MAKNTTRNASRKIRHKRIRSKIKGTAERPRLSVFRSLKHIYAQLIDDVAGKTLVHASSKDNSFGEQSTGNAQAAAKVGELIAERATSQGVTQVVFDRSGNRYHGRIKALADAAREKGLSF